MRTYPLSITVAYGYIPSPDGYSVVPRGETFDFTIRLLTRGEYRRLYQDGLSGFEFEDAILTAGVVGHPETYQGEPWSWEDLPAGLPSRVAAEILQYSGFDEAKSPVVMEEVQAYLESEEAGYDLMIMTAFGNYRRDELDDLPADEWYRLIGLANRKLAILQLDPEVFITGQTKAPQNPIDMQSHMEIQGMPAARQGWDPRHPGSVEWQRPETQTFAFTSG